MKHGRDLKITWNFRYLQSDRVPRHPHKMLQFFIPPNLNPDAVLKETVAVSYLQWDDRLDHLSLLTPWDSGMDDKS